MSASHRVTIGIAFLADDASPHHQATLWEGYLRIDIVVPCLRSNLFLGKIVIVTPRRLLIRRIRRG
jgi:hypothetical protein